LTTGKHILLVDDEKHVLLTTQIVLLAAGYRVSTAENVRAALQKLMRARIEAHDIDLLVTDVDMPGLNGLELVDLLRILDFSMPVLLMSGRSDEELEAEMRKRELDQLLEKPFSPDVLRHRVDYILSSK